MTPDTIQKQTAVMGFQDDSSIEADDLAASTSTPFYKNPSQKPSFSEIEHNKRYNAHHPNSAANVELSTTLWPHLQNCIEHDLPLISFHSPRGFKKCCQLLFDPSNNPGEPQKPSALQLLLQHCDKTATPRQLSIPTPNGQVVLTLKDILISDNEGKMPTIEAQIEVKGPGNTSPRTLNILEMAPNYDGKALNHQDLTTCFNIAKTFQEKTKGPDKQAPLLGQFSSANGIGRSASLLIMSQFEEFLNEPNSPLNKIPTTNEEVRIKVGELINKIRQHPESKKFVHSKKQEDEIVKACINILDSKNTTTAQQAIADHSQTKNPETPSQIKAPTRAPEENTSNSSTPTSNQPPIKPLEVADLKTTIKPHWSREHNAHIAYKEETLHMQCAKQSMNCFFQAPIITSRAIVTKWATQLLNRLKDFNYLGEGLYKQTLLHRLINKGQEEITVTKKDFISEEYDKCIDKNQETILQLYTGDNRSTEDMWKALVNLKNPEKTFLDHYQELNQITELKITASDWFSAMPGLGMNQTAEMLNEAITRLKTKAPGNWEHLPNQMNYLQLWTKKSESEPNTNLNPAAFRDFQNKINQYIDNNPEKQVALVLLTGRDQTSNHYFTIMYQPETESWLSLNAEGTNNDGKQEVSIYCTKDELAETLESKNPKIQAILTPAI